MKPNLIRTRKLQLPVAEFVPTGDGHFQIRVKGKGRETVEDLTLDQLQACVIHAADRSGESDRKVRSPQKRIVICEALWDNNQLKLHVAKNGKTEDMYWNDLESIIFFMSFFLNPYPVA